MSRIITDNSAEKIETTLGSLLPSIGGQIDTHENCQYPTIGKQWGQMDIDGISNSLMADLTQYSKGLKKLGRTTYKGEPAS